MRVDVSRGVVPDLAELSDAERAALVLRHGPRRDEWIAGRIAMRRALRDAFGTRADGASVLIAPDGAPLVVGAPPCAISLSHDGPWIAVMLVKGGRRAGIDVCLREHAARTARILGRLGARLDDVDECTAWAALEATLKLLRMPIMALRERDLEVRGHGPRVEVRGLDERGIPTVLDVMNETEYVVAFTWDVV